MGSSSGVDLQVAVLIPFFPLISNSYPKKLWLIGFSEKNQTLKLPKTPVLFLLILNNLVSVLLKQKQMIKSQSVLGFAGIPIIVVFR